MVFLCQIETKLIIIMIIIITIIIIITTTATIIIISGKLLLKRGDGDVERGYEREDVDT